MKKITLIVLCLLLTITTLFLACKKSENNGNTSSTASITALNCATTSFSNTAAINTTFNATALVPYSGGNAGVYTAGTAVASTGVTGLTATLLAGTLASGTGYLSYTITGTPLAAGTANFEINFGNQNCSIALTVNAIATTSNCDSLSGVAKLICLCDAFKSTLSTSQIATTQLAYTFSNIKTWSNLPAAMSARVGIKLGNLNTIQLAAAKAIIKQMSGTVANEGWQEIEQLWGADDYLAANGGGTTYGAGNYYLGFFGTPATTGTFEIMMTGHHKTVANTYKDGVLIAATPHFAATEPLSFSNAGITYSPITQEKEAFVNILAGLSNTQLATAKSSATFSDLLLGPNANWSFPTTSAGLLCNTLNTTQKAAVLNAIKTYVNDIDDENAAIIIAQYNAELDNTYILYSGTTNMNTRNDYFRIDGPHVWIEFSVQNGIILSGVHYHSVWRDRLNDYGTTH
jgi:Protein of unknown function (DUF3500)